MARWVEKPRGANGWFFITQKRDEVLAKSEDTGSDLWKEVGERFKRITADSEDAVILN